MSTAHEPLVLGPSLAGTLMTPEEFDAVEECDELYCYELINGVLVVTPPPSVMERGPNDLLGYLLRTYQGQRPNGAALNYTIPGHCIPSAGNRRRADRAVWAGLGRVPNLRSDLPTIAIEFVSEGKRDRNRDYVEKRNEYLDAGIAEYWIIDRFRRQMTVVRATDRSPEEIVVQEQESYSSPLLPGFELPPAQILAEADMLDQAQE
jgi:Uma2 family endonuclease